MPVQYQEAAQILEQELASIETEMLAGIEAVPFGVEVIEDFDAIFMRCPRCDTACTGQKAFVKHVMRCKAPKKVPEVVAERPVLLVSCFDCGLKFENAIKLGQHRTQKHFGESSVAGSSLGGKW